MYQPAQTSRRHGRAFETRAARFLRGGLGLTRPDVARLDARNAATLRTLRPQNRPSALEAQTVAEGLWADPHGTLVWVECSGTPCAASKPGLQRSDSMRKIAGTLNTVHHLCRFWSVDPPRIVLVTSHPPLTGSSSAEYLRWAVVEPYGPNNVDLYELDPNGVARRLALPADTAFS